MTESEKKKRVVKLVSTVKESLGKTLPPEMQMDGNLLSFLDHMAAREWTSPDTKTKELGMQFLEEARRDAKSCRLLYSRKFYAHAMYHLQQAVEKAVKGYVIIEGFYKVSEMKEILLHDSPLVIIKALTEKTGMKSEAIRRGDKTTLAKLHEAERTISNDENRAGMAKLSRTDVRNLLSQMEELNQIAISAAKEISRLFQKEDLTALSEKVIRSFGVQPSLLILAMITFPHWSYSRYPGGKIVPADYSLGFGIVQECPQLIKLLEANIETLEAAYRE